MSGSVLETDDQRWTQEGQKSLCVSGVYILKVEALHEQEK